MASSNKVQRTCITITRYLIKRTGSICHVTINDRGETHHTWLHANGSTACDCKSTCGRCYHREHVRKLEAARQAIVSTPEPVVQPRKQQSITHTSIEASLPAFLQTAMQGKSKNGWIPGRVA